MRSVLEEKLGRDPEAFDERTDGQTCLFAFSVSDDGRPLFDTFVLSSCAWALSRTLKPGPESKEWLTGFEEYAKELAQDFANRYAVLSDDARGQELTGMGFKIGRIIKGTDLLSETQYVAQKLGLGHLLPKNEVRIKSGLVASARKYSAEESDFINSFYLKDLAKVAAASQNGGVGTALKSFLEESPDTDSRIDVAKSIETQFRQLSPALFPRGRWPSNGHHPLVFSQQFAINTAVQELGNAKGIFAVNGPPGTGKTTLLRDLIASIVVERAQRLSELSHPDAAFNGEGRWKVDKFNRVVALWKDQFKGFEIVIASNNNGAVENVSFEIPSRDAVDESWLKESDYFTDFGTRLLDRPAWAMLAARLGNKANRSDFAKKFWYGAKDGKRLSANDISGDGFLNWLKSLEGQQFDWKKATEKYKAAVKHEQKLRTAHVSIFNDYASLIALSREIPTVEQLIVALEKNCAHMREQQSNAEDSERQLSGEVTIELNRRLEHRKFRPSLIEIVLSFGKTFREWRTKDRTLATQLELAQKKLLEGENVLARSRSNFAKADAELRKAHANLEKKRAEFSLTRDRLLKGKQSLGSNFPALETWAKDAPGRELSSPWASEAWNRARAEVFLAALELHKAFILANPDRMRKSLQAAMDVVTGAVPDGASPEAIQAAWTTFFFVVPVASTTFASFDRLFAQMGKETLGWLLIDEAGQAVPQTAAGALWRARRAMVVGDPLQLEPVVTLPFTAQQALRRHFQVSETWLPGRTSVQQLADRVSRYGTTVKTQDESIWIGSPLRVHRRCDQPMFDISNAVAYDGLMVFGTQKRKDLTLQPSGWIHVEGEQADGHWIEEEGHATSGLLCMLTESGVSLNEIFLISPFRVVVRRLRELSRKYPGIRVGTIHTAQGKESDVVIVVLGGHPQRHGAKEWASSKPNLLNVAASRAKRRLYVIGNQSTWKRYPFFSTCSMLLERNNGGIS